MTEVVSNSWPTNYKYKVVEATDKYTRIACHLNSESAAKQWLADLEEKTHTK